MNGTAVWESNLDSSAQATPTQTILQPGQSITDSGTWNGIANEGEFAGTNVWGALNVSFSGAAAALGYEVSITSPLKQSVTTDQSVYQAGDPVQMTATETNESDQSITLLNSGDQFVLEGYGGPVLAATGGAPLNQVVTLQPGQSQMFTVTWDESGVLGPASSPIWYYNVLFQDAFQGFTSPQFVIDNATPPTNLSGDPGGSSGGAPPLSSDPGGQSGGSAPTPSDPSPTLPVATSNEAPVSTTLTANHSSTRAITPVRLTLTFDNVSKKAVRLTRNGSTDRITVLNGSTVVSSMKRDLLGSKARILAAGKTAKFTTVLRNILPTHGASARLKPATYTVEVDEGGYVASAPIRIV